MKNLSTIPRVQCRYSTLLFLIIGAILIATNSFAQYFTNCTNLILKPIDTPDCFEVKAKLDINQAIIITDGNSYVRLGRNQNGCISGEYYVNGAYICDAFTGGLTGLCDVPYVGIYKSGSSFGIMFSQDDGQLWQLQNATFCIGDDLPGRPLYAGMDVCNGNSNSDVEYFDISPKISSGMSVDAGPDLEICSGQSTAQLGFNLTIFHQLGPLTYKWTPSTGLSSPFSRNPIARPLVTTTYTVEVTDTGWCNSIATDQVTVKVNPPPIVTFNPVGPLSANEPPVDLLSFVSPAGGTFKGCGISGNTFNPAVVGGGKFTLTYQYTDGHGCINSASQSVEVKPDPKTSFQGKIYLANGLVAHKIRRANLDGKGFEDLFDTGSGTPYDIALGLPGGRMYWTLVDFQSNFGRIQSATLDGNDKKDLYTGLTRPQSIALDVANGMVYWSAGSTIQRAQMNGTGGVEDVVTGITTTQHDFALNLTQGRIYWASSNKIKWTTLNAPRVEQTLYTLALPFPPGGGGFLRVPYGIALDVAGNKIYWTTKFGSPQIHRANLDGTGAEETLISNNPFLFGGMGSIALDVANDKMYFVGYSDDGHLWRANLNGSNLQLVGPLKCFEIYPSFGIELFLTPKRAIISQLPKGDSPAGGTNCPEKPAFCDIIVKPSSKGAISKDPIIYAIYGGTPPQPLKNVPVAIELYVEEFSGGHCHNDDGRPIGSYDKLTGNTGSDGMGFKVTHTWPDVAGKLKVRFYSTNQKFPFYYARDPVFTYCVLEQGLEQLKKDDNVYELIGDLPWHPDNHYGDSRLISALEKSAQEYNAAYKSSLVPKLKYNDISLPWGGRFDIYKNWKGSHKEHMVGLNCDLRAWRDNKRGLPDLPSRNRQNLKRIFEENLLSVKYDCGGNILPKDDQSLCKTLVTPLPENLFHWHLTYTGVKQTISSAQVVQKQEAGASAIMSVSTQKSALGGSVYTAESHYSGSNFDVTVKVSVQFDAQTKLYTYSYVMTNAATSAGALQAFALDIKQPTEIFSPSHWSSSYGYDGIPEILVWNVTDPGEPPSDWVDTGANLYVGEFHPIPGTNVSGFTITSPLPPDEVLYFVEPWHDIPFNEGEEGPPPPTIVETPITGKILGPVEHINGGKADAGSDKLICLGQSVTLGGNPTASGGTPPYIYKWTPTTGLLDPDNVANPKARPAKTTTYTVEVTDVNSSKATDQVIITVKPFVFLADDLVKISQNKTSSGNIHSNNDIEFGKGAPGTHTGNLSAVDDITMDDKNTIKGNVIAGDDVKLSGNAKVTGTIAKKSAVTKVPLPQVSFSADGPDVTVPKNAAKTLAPGSYDDVEVKEKGILNLRAGDYFMGKLSLGLSAILSIDVSGGPVNIHVVDALRFGDKVKVKITGTGAATDKITFLLRSDSKMEIGKSATIQGTIIAPRAEVHFGGDSKFKGAVCADVITLDAKVTFSFHSPGVLTKESEMEESAVEESEAASDEQQVTSYELVQNYPNPFNPSTTIKFAMPEAGHAKLLIYDINGNLVKTLVSDVMLAGRHSLVWDGTNAKGIRVASGVYIYRLEVNGFVANKKMILTK